MASSNNSVSKEPQMLNYAGFGKRFIAYLVDFLILFIVGLVIQSALGFRPFAYLEANSLEELQVLQQSSNNQIVVILSLLLSFAYLLIMWVNYEGATLGKKLLAIKIVNDDGSSLSYPKAFVRYIGYFVSGAPLALGFLWILLDKKKQGWHDKIAETVVVETKEKPKTLLGIFLALFAILILGAYYGLAFAKGFSLGFQEVEEQSFSRNAQESIEKDSQNISIEARKHYDKSRALFEELNAVRNDPEAIKPLAEKNVEQAKLAVEKNPENALLWENLGNAYTWLNSSNGLEDALEAYKKAEELDPKNVVYINNVGSILSSLERYEEAVLQYNKSLRITDDQSGYTYIGLANAYDALEVYDEATLNYEKAMNVFKSQNEDGQFDSVILSIQKKLSNLRR